MLKRKKIIILIIIILLLIIAGGVFWWWSGREIKGSPEDYVIKETEEEKIVENKRGGLVMKVPEGWKTEKVEFEEGAVNFYSPNTEIELREGKIVLPLKKGCIISVGLAYKKMDFSQIEFEIRYTHSLLGKKSEAFEKIIINNRPALKNTFDTQQLGEGIGVNIPYKNKVYAFYLYWGPGEKENCAQEFDKFLETVSIK